MPVSAFQPDVVVEVAFASAPDDPSPVWTDVSSYVEATSPIVISRGRSDELSDIQPSRLTVVLDNTDGRFTPGNSSSPYYPNVRKNRKIRVSATPVSSTVRRRFTGYVDEWPVNWPSGTDEYSSSTVTASSRRARLAAGSELRSIIEEEYLLDEPIAYYPMGEPQPVGNGQAGDVSGNQTPNLVAAGTGPAIQWQAATGPGTDGMSAPVFNDGRYLLLDGVDLFATANRWFTLEAFVNTTDSGTTRAAAAVFGPNGWHTWIGIDTTGHASSAGGDINQGPDFTLTSSATINDGLTHHLAVRLDRDFANVSLFLDGVEVHDGATFNSPTATRMTVGGYDPPGDATPQSGGWIGSVSHVAVTSSDTELTTARIADHAESGLTGFEGESSDARIERLATIAGVPATEVSTEPGLTTSMAAQETTGKTALDQMEQVADTEGGILFDAADGTLTFHARDHRYNAAVAFTLDAGLQQIEASLEAKLDGQQLVNDVTATRVGGDSAIRVVNTDSITEHGVRRETLELYTTSDAEVADAANWRLHRYAEPDVRVHSVSVDLINSPTALVTALVDAELGDKITLANLPDQAPDTSMDGFVDGITETIGPESYTIGFELTPATEFDVWQLDSATHSQLDQTTVLAF